jgi:RNA polymerase sigma factor (sigma-70 family)
MAASELEQTVRRIGRMVVAHGAMQGDAELIRAFSSDGDQRAFAEIVKRHGGLVRSVCRRVLGDRAGVDDAWQATFLVLARRASSVSRSGSLAGWLHGVAYRTALCERRASLRRSKHEAKARLSATSSPEKLVAWRELMELLDAEIQRLPTPLREVFVRVCLEEATGSDVASELGLNDGTVRSRLTRARRMLRGRLERRGVCLTAVLALTTVAQPRVSASLIARTSEAAAAVASGRPLPIADVSVRATILAQEAGRSLAFVPKLVGGFLLILGVLGISFAQLGSKPAEPEPAKQPPPPAKVEPMAVDGDPLPSSAVARFGTSRFRPGGSITRLVFEPSGNRLASWSEGARDSEQFTLWEAETGKEVRANRTASSTLVALAWPSNGVGIAIISEPHDARLKNLSIWEFTAEKPTPLREPKPQGGRIAIVDRKGSDDVCNSAAVSMDGKRIAIATLKNGVPDVVLILEAKIGTPFADLKKVAEFAAPPKECEALAFTPDGKRLVGICPIGEDRGEAKSCKIVIWNSDGKIERSIDAPKIAQQGSRPTYSVANDFIAVGNEDGDVTLFDLATAKARTLKTGHKSKGGGPYGTFAVAFSHDGKSLATAGRDNMVRVVDVASGRINREFGPHGSWPEAIAWSSDGSRIASAGQDAVIRLWDPVAGKEVGPTGGNRAHVWRASISSDAKTAVTEGGNGIRVWDAATGAERRRIDAGGNVTYCGLSPDAKQVIAIVGPWEKPERAFKVWDVSTGVESAPKAFPKTLIASGFRFSPDGKTLITYHDSKISAWNWPAGTKLWTADMPKPANQPGVNQVDGLAFAPDGRQFITIGDRYWFREERGMRFGYGADGIVDLWDATSGKYSRRLVESNGCFRPGRYAANGLFIHSGGGTFPGDMRGGSAYKSKAQLCAVDPLTGRVVREFGPAGRADGFDSGFTVGLSADGKVLFRATGVGEIHLFEVSTGNYRTALVGHKGSVLALDTPTDVRRVLSGSWDTSSLLWDVGLFSKKGDKLADDERAKLWEALSDIDGTKAFAAMQKFGGDPEGFLEVVSASLKPAPEGPSAAELTPIFADLDHKTFARREAASAKLEKYGEGAIAHVRARLETESSAEARDRLKRFLEKCDAPESSSIRLRQSRAIELLEHLGTAKAKELLEKLAKGGASYLTEDAKGSLKRIAIR